MIFLPCSLHKCYSDSSGKTSSNCQFEGLESIHGQSDVFPNDRVGEVFDDEGEQRCQDLWGDERAVDYRLAMLERKLDELTLRVNSGQPATTAIDELKNRVVVLENEKNETFR